MSSTRENLAVLLGFVAMCAVGMGAFALLAAWRDPGRARGDLVVGTPERGGFTLRDPICDVGRAGVRVHGDGSGALRVEPGPRAFIEPCADCAEVELLRADCRRFEVEIGPTNRKFNKVRVWQGSVSLDCDAGPLGAVTGSLALPECV